MLNIAKICRICLAEGARNIFDRIDCSTKQSGGGAECVSSLENLLEKMRYVTMAQIKDNDRLPKLLCDCCIVQLNISYNFKRKAMESELKLRQYIIEKGLDRSINDNTGNTAALYYTSNISIMRNNLENIEQNFNSTSFNETTATTLYTGPNANATVNENNSPETHKIRTIPHPVPIKEELVDSSTETENNRTVVSEQNLTNPNLMVIVNDNNSLFTQSIPSSNTFTIPSSGSSSFTNDSDLRDSEFLRNYVQNRIKFDGVTKKNVRSNKINKRGRTMLKVNREKFLKKHIRKNLDKVKGSPKVISKVPLDLRNLILDQKENFSSVLKMRNQNKKLFYSLRRKEQQNSLRDGRS